MTEALPLVGGDPRVADRAADLGRQQPEPAAGLRGERPSPAGAREDRADPPPQPAGLRMERVLEVMSWTSAANTPAKESALPGQ